MDVAAHAPTAGATASGGAAPNGGAVPKTARSWAPPHAEKVATAGAPAGTTAANTAAPSPERASPQPMYRRRHALGAAGAHRMVREKDDAAVDAFAGSGPRTTTALPPPLGRSSTVRVAHAADAYEFPASVDAPAACRCRGGAPAVPHVEKVARTRPKTTALKRAPPSAAACARGAVIVSPHPSSRPPHGSGGVSRHATSTVYGRCSRAATESHSGSERGGARYSTCAHRRRRSGKAAGTRPETGDWARGRPGKLRSW